MSADIMRRAAAKMRERAEAASEGPWKCYDAQEWYGGSPAWEVDYVPTSGVCEGEDVQVAGGADKADAEHIASWDPTMARAVAELLDAGAAEVARRVARDGVEVLERANPVFHAMTELARTYLHEEG